MVCFWKFLVVDLNGMITTLNETIERISKTPSQYNKETLASQLKRHPSELESFSSYLLKIN